MSNIKDKLLKISGKNSFDFSGQTANNSVNKEIIISFVLFKEKSSYF